MNLKYSTDNKVEFMTSPNISVRHAFTTRFGGVSSGIFESLNLAQRGGDDFENVKENYSRLCSALDITTLDIVCSTQVHGIRIRVITENDRGKLFKPEPEQADGLITQTPAVALMVFTADCVPILLYDPVKKVIGAVHAGWRNTLKNIAGAAVTAMYNEFGSAPDDIKAAIGPCISKCCFETDIEVIHAMEASLPHDIKASDYAIPKGEKYMVDLKGINHRLLEKEGVKDILISDECTSCSSNKYWSHRKTKGQRGSQVAIIVL